MASGAQHLNIEPDAIPYRPQSDPVPEDRRLGESRLGCYAELHDPVRSGRVRLEACDPALLRAAQYNERAVREDIRHLGRIFALSNEELVQPGVGGHHNLAANRRQPDVRHESPRADSRAIDDHRSCPPSVGLGQITQGWAELQLPAIAEYLDEQVIQVGRHVNDGRGVSPPGSETGWKLGSVAPGRRAGAAGKGRWSGFGFNWGSDKARHLRYPRFRIAS